MGTIFTLIIVCMLVLQLQNNNVDNAKQYTCYKPIFILKVR